MLPEEKEDLSKTILAPMPGKIKSIDVKVGDTVAIGQPLMVLEAMKMQNILHAEKSGVIKQISFSVGQDVSVDDTLIEFE